MKPRILLTLALALAALAATATDAARLRLCRAELAEARTAADSLPLLYDIFDLLPKSQRGSTGWQIYNLGARTGNTGVQLDMLRSLATVYADNDSMMTRLRNLARRFPASDEQRETLTYVRVKERTSRTSERAITEMSDEYVARLIKELSDTMPDNSQGINDRVLNMFTIVRFLRKTSPGILMEDLLGSLGKTMEDLPLKQFELRYEFFDQSSNAYTYMNMPLRSVEYSRELLKVLDEKAAQMHRDGRKFYNNYWSRYRCYRRMLINYEALNLDEVREAYRKINEIALVDPDVAADIEANGISEICYRVAVNDWKGVIPLIKKYIDLPVNSEMRRRMLKYLISASRETGDSPLLAYASERYIEIMEDYLAHRYDERVRELQIVTSMNNLNERNRALQAEKLEAETETQQLWSIVAGTVIPVLVIMILVILFIYRRSLRYRRELEKSVSELRSERDNVLSIQQQLIAARNRAQVASRQKTEFINNMTHEVRTPLNAIADYSRLIADCVDDSKRPFLDHYVKLIELNNELVETIINDVLDVSEIDNNRMKVKTEPVAVKPICELAIANASHYLHPGVSLTFANANDPDFTIRTDRHRVEQVLINLLSNAAKFTRQGSITLSYSVEGSRLAFAVTDTGTGIPAGKEELIFQRFEKLDNSTQGAGLGLPISRMVAGLLKGTVRLDTTYSGGARFVFTIPMK